MNVNAVLALLTLLVAAPLNWFVVLRSWREYRTERNLVVLAQFVGFLAVAVIVTAFALIFVHNDLAQPFLDVDTTKLLTRSTLLAGGIIPAAFYLWLYR